MFSMKRQKDTTSEDEPPGQEVSNMVLGMNQDHSVIFEIVSKYCISASLVDSDGYCISSKGLLPTVVDIVVI